MEIGIEGRVRGRRRGSEGSMSLICEFGVVR